MPKQIFLTGASGFIGYALATELLSRGHEVGALSRPGSESKVPSGCRIVPGDALDQSSYASQISPAETFVHLVGVAHPSPSKAAEFRSIDLQSIRQAVPAAVQAGSTDFVYLSVARPAPIMRDYQTVRAEGENLITQAGLNATFVRPWYVLGPGRRWPLAGSSVRDRAHAPGNARRRHSACAGHARSDGAQHRVGNRKSRERNSRARAPGYSPRRISRAGDEQPRCMKLRSEPGASRRLGTVKE